MDFPRRTDGFFSTKGRACSFCRSAYHLPLMMFWAFWFWKIGFMCRFEEHWLRLGWLAGVHLEAWKLSFTVRAPEPATGRCREGGYRQPLATCFFQHEPETRGMWAPGFVPTLALTIFSHQKQKNCSFLRKIVFIFLIVPFLLLWI